MDAVNRSTSPVKAHMDEHTGSIHVILEDYFYKRRGRFISKISLNNNVAHYSPLSAFPFNTAWCPSRSAYLTMINNDGIFNMTPTEHGHGSFSSDKQYLMVKSIFSPYSIHFYYLSGDKAFVLNLTPKRVLGNINKKWLTLFDKFNDTLWLACDYYVTQVKLLQ